MFGIALFNTNQENIKYLQTMTTTRVCQTKIKITHRLKITKTRPKTVNFTFVSAICLFRFSMSREQMKLLAARKFDSIQTVPIDMIEAS